MFWSLEMGEGGLMHLKYFISKDLNGNIFKKSEVKRFRRFGKIRTFASRLLSNKDKQLIQSELIYLCPGWLIRNEDYFSSNI